MRSRRLIRLIFERYNNRQFSFTSGLIFVIALLFVGISVWSDNAAAYGVAVAIFTLLFAVVASTRQQSRRQEYGKLSVMPRIFIYGLAVILLGYILCGKGFAYIHIPLSFDIPLYIGEIVVVFGVIALAFNPGYLLGRWNAVIAIFLLFAMFGTAGMLRHLSTYGVDALRDSAVWYYGIFMILVYAFVAEEKRIVKGLRLYAVVVPYVLAVATCFMFVFGFYGVNSPLLPGMTVKMIMLKGGDLAVHAAALLALLCFSRKGEIGNYLHSKAFTIGVVLAVLLAVVTTNRSGLVAIASVLFVVFLVGKRRQAMVIIVTILLMVAMFSLLDIRMKGNIRRDISTGSLRASVMSIFGSVTDYRYRSLYLGTRRWRLQWWSEIVLGTVKDNNLFWMGRGFGPNMAVEMGYLYGTKKMPLRSPHNSHLGIVYRMGFPGILLWAILNIVFFVSVMRGIYKARGKNAWLYSSLSVVLCFWTAAHVNGTFDVYLEGPMGGIWFWTVMGIGLSLLRIQKKGEQKQLEVR